MPRGGNRLEHSVLRAGDHTSRFYAARPSAGYQATPPRPIASVAAEREREPHVLAIPTRDWAIQVGAFANPALARAVAEGARAQAPDQLRSAAICAATDAQWRFGLVSRSPRPLVGECGVGRLLAPQPASIALRRGPAEPLLIAGPGFQLLSAARGGGPRHSAGAGTTGRRKRMRAPPAQRRLAISSAATTTSTSRGRPESMIMP